MEKTACWRIKPSGPKETEVARLARGKQETQKVKVRRQQLQFEETEEEAKPDEDCNVEVDCEHPVAGSWIC